MPRIELARRRSTSLGWICLGVLAGGIGATLVIGGRLAVGLPLALFGLPLLAIHTWIVIAAPPRLRVDDEGVWFGGGAVVPWAQIRGVNIVTIRARGTVNRALSFDFVEPAVARRSLSWPLRLRRGGVGDLDLAAEDFVDPLATVHARVVSARQGA